MEQLPKGDKGDSGKRGNSLRRLLADNPTQNPAPFSGKPRRLSDFVVPLALVLVMMLGVGILAFSLGINRGKATANSERDRFYEGRAASWIATATAQAANPNLTPGNGSKPSAGFANATYGRVDRFEGEQVTILLLNESGSPTGTSLVITVNPQTKVWRNTPNQTASLKPGDTILFTGERNDRGTFEAKSVLILPAS